MICHFCALPIKGDVYQNRSKSRSMCKSCFEDRYFVSQHDGEVYPKRYLVVADDGSKISSSTSYMFSCAICGCHKVAGLTENPYYKGGRICEACKDKCVKTFNGLYVLKENAIKGDDGLDYDSTSTFNRYVDDVTQEVFYDKSPMVIRSGELDKSSIVVRKLTFNKLKKEGKILCCSGCGRAHLHSDKYQSIAIFNGFKSLCGPCAKTYIPIEHGSIHSFGSEGRSIGIEIECEPTVDSCIDIYNWRNEFGNMASCTQDNSLRGNIRAEFRSPILYEDTFEEWVDEICRRLDARVYNRCGLHIHLGTKDFLWTDISNLMYYCYAYQPYFFSIVSPSRRGVGSNSAGLPMELPIGFAYRFSNKKDFIKSLYGTKAVWTKEHGLSLLHRRCNDQNGPKYGGVLHRYQWINIHGHFNKRAIEIRLHHGTTNKTKIKNWIKLWICVLEHVKKGGFLHPSEYIPSALFEFYQDRAKKLASIKPEAI